MPAFAYQAVDTTGKPLRVRGAAGRPELVTRPPAHRGMLALALAPREQPAGHPPGLPAARHPARARRAAKRSPALRRDVAAPAGDGRWHRPADPRAVRAAAVRGAAPGSWGAAAALHGDRARGRNAAAPLLAARPRRA